MKKTTLLLLMIILGGCAVKNSSNNIKYTFVSLEESFLNELIKEPLVFTISFTQARQARERVKFFFQNYVNQFKPGILATANVVAYSNMDSSKDNLKCKVIFTSLTKRYKIQVSCIKEPYGIQSKESIFHSKNLSHFIRVGVYQKDLDRYLSAVKRKAS